MSRNSSAELSCVVRPAELPPEGASYEIEATPEERSALAARFDLRALSSFAVTGRLEWLRGRHVLSFAGRLRAEVVQSCVVTLEPVHNRIDQDFEVLFTADTQPGVNLELQPDELEPLTGDTLDIGEVAAEELALALDPYPRASGASLDRALVAGRKAAIASGGPGAEGTYRPFEALARLKRTK